MKTGIFCLGAATLAGLASAQPSRHRRHEHFHEKRQVVVTEIATITASAPDVVIYVNEEGSTLSIVTQGATPVAGATTPATQVAVVASSDSSVISVYSAPASSAAETTTSAYSAPSSKASSSAASSSSSSGGGFGYGFSYSPYSGTYGVDVGCKDAATVKSDFELIPSEYDLVRIYGTDCNQVENVLAAASAKNMKVFAGVFDITQVESEIAAIVSAANGDWSNFHTISIGNELINNGGATVEAVVSAIGTARSLLKTAGMPSSVKIVTVDTFIAVENNPALCENSDYAAVNAHAFFDGGEEAATDQGAWILSQMQAVSSACGGKDTVITETGWPTSGDNLGKCYPSPENQANAISSIKKAVSSNIVFFTAFNDMWKAPGYLSVEQSWGMYSE